MDRRSLHRSRPHARRPTSRLVGRAWFHQRRCRRRDRRCHEEAAARWRCLYILPRIASQGARVSTLSSSPSSSSSSSPSYTRNLGAFADCTIVSLDDGLGVSGVSERASQTGSAPRQSTTDRLFPDGDVYKTDTRRSGQVDITGTSVPSADRRSRSFASSANPTL